MRTLEKTCRFLFCCIYFLSFSVNALEFSIKGDAALLINADTGQILFEYQADKVLYPASTTKIATALYALSLDQDVNHIIVAEQNSLASLSAEAKKKRNYKDGAAYWLEPDGTHIALKNGEELSLKDLLKGMLIASGNDAANVIAQEFGPTIPVFMDHLNSYLKTIGCQHTSFKNPHGLHDPQHWTSASDLALMMREALKYPLFCEIIAQKYFSRPKTNKQEVATYSQTNRLIRSGTLYYSKAIGGKTGYHSRAKKTFVGAAREKERTLIVVLMGYPDSQIIFQEAIDLFELAFNESLIEYTYLPAGPQKFTQQLPYSSQPLHTYLADSLTLSYYTAENPQAKCLLHWKNLVLPILKNQQVAEINLVDPKGRVLKSIPLLAANTVEMTFFYKMITFVKMNKLMIGVFILALFGLIFFLKR